jgi:hypothetical protein
VFNPSSLKFKDTDGPQTIKISLQNEPAGPVTYQLNGEDMLFDQCTIRFDKTNWNIPKEIKAIGVPYLGSKKGDTLESSFQIKATGVDGKKVKGAMNATRIKMKAPMASSVGDPHLNLFSGIIIDQHKHVVNYLFKSDEFDVIAGQEVCKGQKKCSLQHYRCHSIW